MWSAERGQPFLFAGFTHDDEERASGEKTLSSMNYRCER